MVVACPRCKVKLKVAEEKIGTQGTRFKCPKCATVLLVKKPQPSGAAKPLDSRKVLVAHEDREIQNRIVRVLTSAGYRTLSAYDGIEAMVSAAKELPGAAVLSVSLPKIFGFEVSARLKKRPETREIKVLLVAALYDKDAYRREPLSLYGSDAYIEEHLIEATLLEKISGLVGSPAADREAPAPAVSPSDPASPSSPPAADIPRSVEKERPVPPPQPEPKTSPADIMVEKARRLARTIIADIYLYSKAKVEDSIRAGTFHSVFASDMKEGFKLYEHRIPAEVRAKGDFFNEAIDNFLAKKKEEIL